ncbi:glycine betaine ABC transporter substrate-binding protein [Gymnodinialimonas sp. 2305UL16-5]|uniref:ABC transporter substrate-binding protein n=1 Tax=Gymnodinialimonas mytili TaxID=3126503 RepID=UPI00309C273E
MKNLTLSAVALGMAMSAGGAVAQDTVMVGEPSWPGARIMANLIGQVIETRLGGEVGYAPGANAVIFAAMDGGRGDIDVHPDVWLPNQQSFVDQYGENVTLSEGSYEGRSGFCVPTYMAEEHNIRTVFDLATPDAQSLFDSDGDGMGEIWVGASGWASTNVHRVKVRDYGIETFLTPTTEDETVFYSRLRDLIENQEGAVFYCYQPHYVHALYDVTMIEEPEYDAALYTMVPADQSANWFEESSIMTGDEVKTVRVAFSNSLYDRNPAAASFLENIDMDAGELSALTFQVVEQGEEIDVAVAAWIEANGAMIDGWLGLN